MGVLFLLQLFLAFAAKGKTECGLKFFKDVVGSSGLSSVSNLNWLYAL